MGNQQHGNPVDSVRIVEVGVEHPNASPVSEPDQIPTAPVRRRNPYFYAAWILVSLMNGLGILWVLGFSRGAVPERYASYVSVDPSTGLTSVEGFDPARTALANLADLGPGLLFIGVSGALALLIVQAVTHRHQ